MILDSLVLAIADFTRKQNFERLKTNFTSQEFYSSALDTIWRGCKRLTVDLVPTFDGWVIMRLNGAVQDSQRKHDPLSRNDRLYYKDYQEKLEEAISKGEEVDCEELMANSLPEKFSPQEKRTKAQNILNQAKPIVSLSHIVTDDIIDYSSASEQHVTDNEFTSVLLKKVKKMGLTNKEVKILTEILAGTHVAPINDEMRTKIITNLPSTIWSKPLSLNL
jgi:hypothetical protein